MLYTDYWDLDFPPFTDEYKVGGMVPTRNSSLVIGRLRFALGMNRTIAAVFGEAGVGKTFLIRVLMEEFKEANWLVGYLPNPCADAKDILELFRPDAARTIPAKANGMSELKSFLTEQAEIGQPVLLAVDDVQASRNTDFLELLRTLMNIEAGGKKPMSVLLGGQPSMALRLESASRMDTQLSVKAVVTPMLEDEAKLYILSRLKTAGSKQGVFTKQAADRVVELTKGSPRQINRLCELALVIAFGFGVKKIDPTTIEMAAADLDLLPAEETVFFPWERQKPKKRPPEENAPPDEEDVLASLDAAAKAEKEQPITK